MFSGSVSRGHTLPLLAFALLIILVAPSRAQESVRPPQAVEARGLLLTIPNYHASRSVVNFQTDSSANLLRSFAFSRAVVPSPLTRTATWGNSVSMIDRMESAFYCNDTPFIDQVRLPLGTFWGGRIKLTGFESDVTTANFVLGLPGGGTLHSLSMFGSGHLATWTPPSDQLVGMNMVFTLRGAEVQPGENSGFRGVQYLVKASRGILQTFISR